MALGQGDTLEKEMATHSSSLAWEIPWTEEPVRLQSMGSMAGVAGLMLGIGGRKGTWHP